MFKLDLFLYNRQILTVNGGFLAGMEISCDDISFVREHKEFDIAFTWVKCLVNFMSRQFITLGKMKCL